MADLFPYQNEGALFLAMRDNALLADEPGLGKTAQAIRAADMVRAERVLVVCPGIARENWRREFATWQRLEHDVEVVSYSALASAKHRQALRARGRNDLLIVDEAHYAKNQEAKRTQAIYGHRFDAKHGLASFSDRVWLLSGTIMPNHPGELWTHMHALFGYERPYGDWVGEFCTVKNDGFSDKITGGKRVEEMTELLRPHALRRDHKVVPVDLFWQHIVVSPDKLPPQPDLAPEAQAVLGDLRRRVARDGDHVDLEEAAIHLTTLRRWIGIAKAAAVAEMVSETDGKVIVFATHREVISRIAELVGPSAAVLAGYTPGLYRQAIIDAFQQEKDPRVLICNFDIASAALTLTAAHRVIFAEPVWRPDVMKQAAKRAHRIGQTQPVIAQVISLAGSIDELVNATLVRKLSLGRRFDLALTSA